MDNQARTVEFDFTNKATKRYLRRDRLKYQKNKLSSSITLLAILFNAFYFVIIYRSLYINVRNYFFNITIGVSVLYNLVFMLVAFLGSEGVKNYKPTFAGILIILGGIQIFRIFKMPLKAFKGEITFMSDGVSITKTVLNSTQFTLIAIYLSISAFLLILAGVICIIKFIQLKLHLRELKKTIQR